MSGLLVLLDRRYSMKTIFLTETECYCGLLDFYTKIAEKIGFKESDISKFAIRKIHISKSCYSKICSYYMHEREASGGVILTLFVLYGPKIDVPGDKNNEYIVVVEDGFIVCEGGE